MILRAVGGLVCDALPLEPFRSIQRNTRIFTLYLLGRRTSTPLAAVVAMLISGTAAFSEECAFRGFLFTILGRTFGLPAALIGSSVLFGLAHFQQCESNVLTASLLGATFGYAYHLSGYNIAVPIAVHTLYDFATLFVTWMLASADLRQKVALAKEQLQGTVKEEMPLAEEFVVIARAVRQTCAICVHAYFVLPLNSFSEARAVVQYKHNGQLFVVFCRRLSFWTPTRTATLTSRSS